MKAITCPRYGSPDVLRLEDLEKPTPGDNQVLVRVRAASVNPLDWHTMRGRPYFGRILTGMSRPKNTRPGVDVAGQVEAVGRDVTGLRPGDEVFGACRGAFAEYVCTQGKALTLKPANLTFEQAAAVPVAGFTALQGLRDKGQIQSGQKVLVNGASGGVGTFAVQIARAFGAEVTAVCRARNVDMVRSLGADHVVNYTQEDFIRTEQQYDVVLDSIGNRSWPELRRVLTPAGTCVMVGGPIAHLLKGVVLSRFVNQRLVFFIARANREDLVVLKELIESGKVSPVIDRCYALSEVPEAIRYLGEGHARGKVVIGLE